MEFPEHTEDALLLGWKCGMETAAKLAVTKGDRMTEAGHSGAETLYAFALHLDGLDTEQLARETIRKL